MEEGQEQEESKINTEVVKEKGEFVSECVW